jgi:hypothetical protein
MSAADRAALRALAEKATPGPWSASEADEGKGFVAQVFGAESSEPQYESGEGDSLSVACLDGPDERGTRNAAYIAAAHPAAVLALLDEAERLTAALATARADALREAAERARCVPIPDDASAEEAHGRISAALEATMRILSLLPSHQPATDTSAFLDRILAAAQAGERVTAEDVARLRQLADWADAAPAPGWDGTLDKGEAARAVEAARKRMAGHE